MKVSITETYLEPSRKSTTKHFWKIANDFKPLSIFAKDFIVDVRLDSKCASAHSDHSCHSYHLSENSQAAIASSKLTIRNTRARCEICSKLTSVILNIIHTLFCTSIVNFELVNASGAAFDNFSK